MIDPGSIACNLLLYAGREVGDAGVAVGLFILLILEGGGQSQIGGEVVAKAQIYAEHGGVVEIVFKAKVTQVVDVVVTGGNQG